MTWNGVGLTLRQALHEVKLPKTLTFVLSVPKREGERVAPFMLATG